MKGTGEPGCVSPRENIAANVITLKREETPAFFVWQMLSRKERKEMKDGWQAGARKPMGKYHSERNYSVRRRRTEKFESCITKRRSQKSFWIADVSPQNEKFALAGDTPANRTEKRFSLIRSVARGRATSRGVFPLRRFGMHDSQHFVRLSANA